MPSEVIQVGAMQIQYLVEGHESSGSVAMFTVLVPHATRMPAPHSHDAYEETIYGLEGTTTWTVSGEERDLAPGEALCIPRGAIHAFDNRGDADARILCAVTPGILGPDYFREVAAVFAAPGAPDVAAIGEVMRRHGLSPAPPAA